MDSGYPGTSNTVPVKYKKKPLCLSRFEALKKRDTDFNYRWRHLGEVSRTGVTEFDWDSNLEDGTTEKYRGK